MTAVAMHEIPARFVIASDAHWVLNHRIDSALPGYRMLSSRHSGSLGQLPIEALRRLGDWLARAERAMQARLDPARIYVGRRDDRWTGAATRLADCGSSYSAAGSRH